MGINVNYEFSKLWKSDTNLKRNSSKLTNKVKREKSTKQAIEIIKKPENNPQRHLYNWKKCAGEHIWRLKLREEKKENKMENEDF